MSVLIVHRHVHNVLLLVSVWHANMVMLLWTLCAEKSVAMAKESQMIQSIAMMAIKSMEMVVLLSVK